MYVCNYISHVSTLYVCTYVCMYALLAPGPMYVLIYLQQVCMYVRICCSSQIFKETYIMLARLQSCMCCNNEPEVFRRCVYLLSHSLPMYVCVYVSVYALFVADYRYNIQLPTSDLAH